MLIDGKQAGFWDLLCFGVAAIVGGVYWFFQGYRDPEVNWIGTILYGVMGLIGGGLVGVIIAQYIPRFITIIVLSLIVIGVVTSWF